MTVDALQEAGTSFGLRAVEWSYVSSAALPELIPGAACINS
jgi:hypothetical protein